MLCTFIKSGERDRVTRVAAEQAAKVEFFQTVMDMGYEQAALAAAGTKASVDKLWAVYESVFWTAKA